MFNLGHRCSQLLVVASAIAFATLSISPSLLPDSIGGMVTDAGYMTEAQLVDPAFWFWQGIIVVSLGVVCIIAFSYLRSLVDVNRHLKDIETLMGDVSNAVPQARDHRGGQGVLRKAVDTMTEFFQR